MEKPDNFREAGSITARRKACGYRINWTCANCKYLVRGWSGQGQMTGNCSLHEFPVNIDRGICDQFDNLAKYGR